MSSLHRFFLVVCLGLLGTPFQSDAAEPGLIAEGATVQKLANGFRFTEGPAADAEGNVYFTDIPNARIHKWSVDGKLSTVRENSGQANGLFFDDAGHLVACEGGNRQLTRITLDNKIKVTVLADSYNGKKLNSPNDLWIDPAGGIYFTDPRYGNEDGLEQDGFHVYYLPAGDGEMQRVIDDLVKPNGIIGTADGKTLYVADAGGGKIYSYAIQKPGVLTKRKKLIDSGSDGMTLDEKGNIYLTRGQVHVYKPNGEKLTTIEVPEGPANVTFGGKDNKTLFITARTGFYSLQMNVAGQ